MSSAEASSRKGTGAAGRLPPQWKQGECAAYRWLPRKAAMLAVNLARLITVSESPDHRFPYDDTGAAGPPTKPVLPHPGKNPLPLVAKLCQELNDLWRLVVQCRLRRRGKSDRLCQPSRCNQTMAGMTAIAGGVGPPSTLQSVITVPIGATNTPYTRQSWLSNVETAKSAIEARKLDACTECKDHYAGTARFPTGGLRVPAGPTAGYLAVRTKARRKPRLRLRERGGW